jgi:hypothetical protein
MPTPLSEAPVPLEESPYFSQTLWWDTELWNKTAERVYAMPGIDSYSAWPKPLLEVDEETGALRVEDPQRHVVVPVADVRWGLRGAREVARQGPLALLEVPRPYELDWLSRGLGVDGTVFAGTQIRIRVFGDEAPAARLVALELTGLPGEEPARRYRLRGEGRSAEGVVEPGAGARAEALACAPAGGHADVRLAVPDPVAFRVQRIEARPAPEGACG